jgi:hypothetical protein
MNVYILMITYIMCTNICSTFYTYSSVFEYWLNLAEVRQHASEDIEIMVHCIEMKTEICFTAVKIGKWKYEFYFIKISQYFIFKYIINIHFSYISAVSTFISNFFCYENNIIHVHVHYMYIQM